MRKILNIYELISGDRNPIRAKFTELTLYQNLNSKLQVDIEQNMNALYDGPFQRDIRQSPTSHLEIMDNSDYIFYNISEGLKAMDEIR